MYLGREYTIFRVNRRGTAILTSIPDTPSRHQEVSWTYAGPTHHHSARSDQSGEHRKLDGTRAVASRPQSRLYSTNSINTTTKVSYKNLLLECPTSAGNVNRMKAYRGTDVQVHTFLDLPLDGGEGSDSRSDRLISGKSPRCPFHRLVVPRSRSPRFEEEKNILHLPGIELRIVRPTV
jgi:hypothetical protein